MIYENNSGLGPINNHGLFNWIQTVFTSIQIEDNKLEWLLNHVFQNQTVLICEDQIFYIRNIFLHQRNKSIQSTIFHFSNLYEWWAAIESCIKNLRSDDVLFDGQPELIILEEFVPWALKWFNKSLGYKILQNQKQILCRQSQWLWNDSTSLLVITFFRIKNKYWVISSMGSEIIQQVSWL